MAIIETLSFWQFRDALKRDEYNNYSNEAIEALFDYLESLSEDIGENFEMDVVAIRCEWSEYHVQDLWDEYSNVFEEHDLKESDDADDYDKQLEILSEYTTILDYRRAEHIGNVLVQAF